MRILAIDYGTKRIGIALSDPLGLTAQPYAVLENGPGLLSTLSGLINEKSVERVIVGLPRTLKGEISISAEKVRGFIERLRAKAGVPVEEYDERLTTAQAEKALIGADMRRDKRKSVIDKVAAAYLLQNYMDSKKGRHA